MDKFQFQQEKREIKKFTTPSAFDFAVGGQAVVEGVMMRSPNYTIVSVRKENGEIVTQEEFYQNLSRRIRLLGLPIVRGVVNMLEMMVIGTKALNFAASQFMQPANSQKLTQDQSSDEPSKNEEQSKKSQRQEKKESKIGSFFSLAFSIIFALSMSLFLFKFLPLWVTDLLSKRIELISKEYLLFNFVDGMIKMTFFIAYIWILGLLPEIKRVFQYHGAEHKSIMAYENKLELTVENAKKQTRFHPRCGTSFILVVFLISIFIYTFVPRQPDFLMNFFTRVMFLPLVAGFSYEILKWSAKHDQNKLVKILIKPGLLFQRLTTKEPDDQMLEVALTSLKTALRLEKVRTKVVL